MLDVVDLSTFEDGCVEIGRFFCLAVEPKTWGDLRRHFILVSGRYERARLVEEVGNWRKLWRYI